MTSDLERWKDDGGAATNASPLPLEGTPIQVEWAERIKLAVNDEFDRVAASFRTVALKQSHAKRAETEAVIAILEDKRLEVMSRRRAGYFIKSWQEITDQVRRMIFDDARYQEIKRARSAAKPPPLGR